MEVKALEIRDDGTFIPALAVDMNPTPSPSSLSSHGRAPDDAQRWLLRRCGYACDGRPNIILTRLDGNGRMATNDYYAYGPNDRTWRYAHKYIIEHWNELKDGDVVDVEFILGERPEPKRSERETAAV